MDSFPSDEVVGGFFFEFEAVRTALTEMLRAGVLYFCDLVQQAPPALRKRCLKLVANKAALCARFDAFGDRSKLRPAPNEKCPPGKPMTFACAERCGPNGLKLEKETTPGIVRWTRVHPRK